MADDRTYPIFSAEVVVPCDELDETLDFFVEKLGFVVETIIPADNPRVAVISGLGVRLRLEIGSLAPKPHLRLRCTDLLLAKEGKKALAVPKGLAIEILPLRQALDIPEHQQELVITKLKDKDTWIKGRVGMRYRDLIPKELGGKFGASHIHVEEAGPLKDYVHYHLVQFQMIYCYKGWVRVVLEDQGPPILMEAGDCILQPPEIRHRVLESSGDLHVIELSCPSGHETHADRDMELPTPTVNPEREFSGQQFVNHVAKNASWGPWFSPGIEARDLLINEGTRGLAGAYVVRPASAHHIGPIRCAREFFFVFILAGTMVLEVDNVKRGIMVEGDSFVFPQDCSFSMTLFSSDLEFLHVVLPGELAMLAP